MEAKKLLNLVWVAPLIFVACGDDDDATPSSTTVSSDVNDFNGEIYPDDWENDIHEVTTFRLKNGLLVDCAGDWDSSWDCYWEGMYEEVGD